MNHFEIKEFFEEKMKAACDAIKNAKNGDKLDIQTSTSYVNDKLVEKTEYNGKDNTSLVVSAMIFAKGACGDEDPSYEISLLCDLRGGAVVDPMQLEDEVSTFDAELQRFIAALEESDDVAALINAENEKINLEGDRMVADLEAKLEKMKKIGFIGGLIIFGALLIFMIIKKFR